MADKYKDSTGRVEVSRYKSRRTGAWQWSVYVDRAWLGHFGGGLPSVANHAAAYTRTGLRPLKQEDILRDLNEDLVMRGLEEAQR